MKRIRIDQWVEHCSFGENNWEKSSYSYSFVQANPERFVILYRFRVHITIDLTPESKPTERETHETV
jgi:hypothetical protein